MRLLIFSDNHRDREAVQLAVAQNPGLSHYVSLGDSEMREQELTDLGVYGVRGNYPFEPRFPDSLTLDFFGVKVYFTHGHLHSVKSGLSSLLNHCLYNDIQIACFGHTHKSLLKEAEGVILVNPGSLSRNRIFSESSYALIDIDSEHIEITIKSLTGEIIDRYIKKR